MEAFSDGVLAVIITIMVLEMKSPRGPTRGVKTSTSGITELPAEFRLHRHLLEQPSPPAARNSARQRRDSVG